MATKSETLDAIREAVVAHINAHHETDEGDVVTDFVVIAGWVNMFGEDQNDGVHIVSSETSPGYTVNGLIATASGIYANERE